MSDDGPQTEDEDDGTESRDQESEDEHDGSESQTEGSAPEDGPQTEYEDDGNESRDQESEDEESGPAWLASQASLSPLRNTRHARLREPQHTLHPSAQKTLKSLPHCNTGNFPKARSCLKKHCAAV